MNENVNDLVHYTESSSRIELKKQKQDCIDDKNRIE